MKGKILTYLNHLQQVKITLWIMSKLQSLNLLLQNLDEIKI